MKYIITSVALATISGLCGLAVTILVITNINDLSYGVAMLGLALVVLAWAPFAVGINQVADEVASYKRIQARRLARAKRYTKASH